MNITTYEKVMVICAGIGKDKCKSGACIDKDMICDNSNDCFDDSDESSLLCIAYPHCHFEEREREYKKKLKLKVKPN